MKKRPVNIHRKNNQKNSISKKSALNFIIKPGGVDTKKITMKSLHKSTNKHIHEKIYINIANLSHYIPKLALGQQVFLTGKVFTARDAAHKRLINLIINNKKLPININNSVIYYTGPTQTPEAMIIGSCGPTSSYRMDQYLELLLKLGLIGTIGKGKRSPEAEKLIKQHHAIYFMALGGAGALACKYVKDVKEIAFFDLGCESIKELYFENFPVRVGAN